jgi:hypothetical protein
LLDGCIDRYTEIYVIYIYIHEVIQNCRKSLNQSTVKQTLKFNFFIADDQMILTQNDESLQKVVYRKKTGDE